jgi:hypothetical protein
VALADLARVDQASGHADQALAWLQQSEALLKRAQQRHPMSALLQGQRLGVMLSLAYVYFGWERAHLNQPQAALQQLYDLEAYADTVAANPAAGHQALCADKRGNAASIRALIQLRLQQWAEARDSAAQAVERRARACALEPHNRTWQAGLLADRNLLAGLCMDLGDAQAALAASQPGWLALQPLMDEDPGNPNWPTQRQWLAFHHGRALLATGQPQAALPVLQVSANWLQELQAAGQATPRQQARLVRTWLALAQARQALGAPHDGTAEAWLQQAGELLGSLATSSEADVLKAQQDWAAAQAR